jgi:hypothetical protein
MGLTLEAEQRLKDADLIELFDDNVDEWTDAARQSRKFVKDLFPAGSQIRRDDVAKALRPILEVSETLKDHLDSNKLRGKFWVNFFVDLIVDRTWDQLEGEDK